MLKGMYIIGVDDEEIVLFGIKSFSVYGYFIFSLDNIQQFKTEMDVRRNIYNFAVYLKNPERQIRIIINMSFIDNIHYNYSFQTACRITNTTAKVIYITIIN